MLLKSFKKDNSREQLFEEIYTLYAKKVQFYAYRYLRDHVESKCVAQDVFLTLWENIDDLWEDKDVLPYLFVITKFRCLNILKKRNYFNIYKEQKQNYIHNEDSLAFSALTDISSISLYSKEIEELILKSLEQMPEKVRSTFLYSRYKNLKYQEIAKEQNISIKTVEYRLNYAFKVLRKNLKDYLFLLILLLIISNS